MPHIINCIWSWIQQHPEKAHYWFHYWYFNIDDEDEYEDEEDSQEEGDSIEITEMSGQARGLLLSELLACRELEDLEGEEEDDVKSDPLHSINICQHISQAVKDLTGVKVIQVFAAILSTTAGFEILARIG